MRKPTLLCTVIFTVAFIITMFAVGCTVPQLGPGESSDEGGATYDTGMHFDPEDVTLDFTVDGGLAYYYLTLETDDAVFPVREWSIDGDDDPEWSCRINSLLLENNEALADGFRAVLKKCELGGEERVIWTDSVEFDYLMVPEYTLDKESGKLLWEAVEGALKYEVTVGDGETYETTDTEADLPEPVAGRYVNTKVRPIGAEGEAWISSEAVGFYVSICPTVEVEYSGSYISVRTVSEDNYILIPNTDFIYNVTIDDGGIITERSAIPYKYLGFSIPYVPRSDNLKISVTVSLPEEHESYPVFYDSPIIEVVPECLGVTPLLEFDAANSNITLGEGGYRVTAGEEILYSGYDSVISLESLGERSGAFDIDLQRLSPTDNTYYIARTVGFYFPATPTLTLSADELGRGDVTVSLSGVDPLAVGVETAYYTTSTRTDYHEGERLLGVESCLAQGVIDIPAGRDYVSYRVICTQVFNTDRIVVPLSVSTSFKRLEAKELKRVNYLDDGTAKIFFDGGLKFEMQRDGTTTVSEDYFFTVAGTLAEDETLTLSVRSIPSGDEDCLTLPSEWTDITVKRLPTPKNLRVEDGYLVWDSEGDGTPLRYTVKGYGSVDDPRWYVNLTKPVSDVTITPIAPQDLTGTTVYLNGLESESIRLTRLDKVSISSFSETVLSWETVENAECYRIDVYTSATGLPTQFTQTSTEFSPVDYLKADGDGTLMVYIRAVGDGVSFFDSYSCSFNVTRKSSLDFTLSNEEGCLYWGGDTAFPAFDYKVYGPEGDLVVSKEDVTDTKTVPLTLTAPGEYTLAVSPHARYTSANNTYYMKTGDESLDAQTVTFYQAKYTAVIENNLVYVTTVPALAQRTGYNFLYYVRGYEYIDGKETYIATASGTTTYSKWDVTTLLHHAETDVVYFKVSSVNATDEEYDSLLAFKPIDGWVDFAVSFTMEDGKITSIEKYTS